MAHYTHDGEIKLVGGDQIFEETAEVPLYFFNTFTGFHVTSGAPNVI